MEDITTDNVDNYKHIFPAPREPNEEFIREQKFERVNEILSKFVMWRGKMKTFIVTVVAVVLSSAALTRSIRALKKTEDTEKLIEMQVREDTLKKVRNISRVSSPFVAGRITVEKTFGGCSTYIKLDIYEFLELILQVKEEARKALEEDKKEAGTEK